MTNDDFIYKAQDVNYLGFLEAQLRDLQGIDSLTYELVQNADDAQGETGRPPAIIFDITDEALIVENDGVFRPVDFERMQSIAGGGKREEAGTTGAFGIGFIAVYQVTDRPEIFSNGRHWTIRPEAPPDQRILERSAETEGTRFVLPWAFDERSAVRRALRIETIQPEKLDEIAGRMAEAIGRAALFLRRLQVLEVRRSGRLLKRIERVFTGERLVLQDAVLQNEEGQETAWLVLAGDFAEAAGRLRDQYPWQIEANRQSSVQVAVSASHLGNGCLYAGLPTNFDYPIPVHINAEFFPTVDRKSIHFDGGYQAEWNQAAIECAAEVLSEDLTNLGDLSNLTWLLLQRMFDAQQLAEQGNLPAVFSAFWSAVLPLLKVTPILFTSTGEWRLPGGVRLFPPRIDQSLLPLLEKLNIPLAHPDLLPYFPLMRRPEIGAAALAVQDVMDGLSALAIKPSISLYETMPPLNTLESWRQLWEILDTLIGRYLSPAEKDALLTQLNQCPLVLTDQMKLEYLKNVYRGTPETKALFPDAAWLHEAVPSDTFPGRFIPNFGVRQAVELLAGWLPERLEESWQMGRLELPALFRWFESQQIEIFSDDPALKKEILRLPLCPVDGRLRPLAELYIPGNFEDPLDYTGLIDVEAIGGRRHFLRDLGVPELNFETYVQSQMPQVLANHPDLPSDARHQLVQLLAERLGELQDDAELQAQLGRLPLIACLDGSFRAASETYSSREVQAYLGNQVHIAEPVESRAVQALHRWLGVRDQPAAADIVHSLQRISREAGSQTPLKADSQAIVERCLNRLSEMLQQSEVEAAELEPLRERPVLLSRRHILTRPADMLLANGPELAGRFPMLANFLINPDQPTAALAAALGVRPISQAAELLVNTPAGAEEDRALQEHLTSRLPLIERLLKGTVPAAKVQRLADLQLFTADPLTIQYRLTHRDKTVKSQPENVTAILAAGPFALYVNAAAQPLPWTAGARELLQFLQPERPGAGLVIAVKELLAADSPAEANQTLKELGL